jgi:DNA-binding NarL/FixJ family response regulator
MSKTKSIVNIEVAIVEDDVPAREILAGWIRGTDGFKLVGEYDDAETAVAELPQKKPSVVLFDINLPGMNGIECVRRLKPRLPETQFLMVTVYGDANHIFDALAVGASGYLLKQTRRNELLRARWCNRSAGTKLSRRGEKWSNYRSVKGRYWNSWPAVICTRKLRSSLKSACRP